jgi:hypothetical protein
MTGERLSKSQKENIGLYAFTPQINKLFGNYSTPSIPTRNLYPYWIELQTFKANAIYCAIYFFHINLPPSPTTSYLCQTIYKSPVSI